MESKSNEGGKNYAVKQGDCISSIADKYGLFWERVWNHPQNAKLKEKRKDPNILHEGDIVFVPDKEEKQEAGATEQKHRFLRKGVPEKLRLRLLEDDKPRANIAYLLEIDGNVIEGVTDGDGNLEHPIPPGARGGSLKIGEYEIIPLKLGHLDPIDEVSGVQARLNNLHFNCGPQDGNLGPKTKAALKAFQKKYSLNETGEISEETKNKLRELHGS